MYVHLQVSGLARSEEFYHGLLGLDITQRTYPGALFLSAGGYHHHVGLNVWASRGAPKSPPEAAGLISFGISLPDLQSWTALRDRLTQAGSPVEAPSEGGNPLSLLVRDPDRIGVEILVEEKPAAHHASELG